MSQQTAFVTDDSPSPELVNEINDAFNSNDVSAIMPYFTDDASFNTTRGPGADTRALLHGRRGADREGSRRQGAEGNTYQGKEAIEGAFKALFDSVETVRWEPLDTRIAGDKVYCEYMRKARSKNGEDTEWMTIDVITFRDGLMTQKNSYTKVRAS